LRVGGNGALLLRAGVVQQVLLLQGLGLAVVVIGLGMWVLSLTRYSTAAGRHAPALIAGQTDVVIALSTFVLLLSLIDLAVVIFAR